MATEFRGQPGIYSGPALKARNIFVQKSAANVTLAPSFAFIDGTYSRDTGEATPTILRAGLILGKITTSGLYRPSIIGLTTAAYTSGSTSLTVPATVATEVARLIALAAGNVTLKAIGPPTAAGTVATTAVTCSAASGTTLTVTSLGVDKAAGTVIAPADGSQSPVTIFPGPYPIDVVDQSATALNQPINEFLRGADLIATQIINLVTDDYTNTVDTSVQTFFKTALKTVGVFTFDNDR